jgi:hypothetical protein
MHLKIVATPSATGAANAGLPLLEADQAAVDRFSHHPREAVLLQLFNEPLLHGLLEDLKGHPVKDAGTLGIVFQADEKVE